VEVSAKIENVKYLHKYLVKMPDRAEVVVQMVDGKDFDETKVFLDGRYISTSEAVWRALRFPVHYQSPPVMRLAVHLEGEQFVMFGEDANVEDIVQQNRLTTLTAWFESNKEDDRGAHLLYPDYVSQYRFVKGKWKQPVLLLFLCGSKFVSWYCRSLEAKNQKFQIPFTCPILHIYIMGLLLHA
jgi:hypothetical protein